MDNPAFAIGIMSGTSVDAIDAVLLKMAADGSPEVVSTYSESFPDKLRQQILDLTSPGDNEIDRAGKVHKELGLRYAGTVKALLQQPETPTAADIAVIGCHGQTVRHRPDDALPFTLQLGCGATIAQQTGITTVADFRSADMAAGGQGAPFAPFFHHAVFSQAGEVRAIVNLGGIANITLLDGCNRDSVIGFDSGPANGLMDAWIQKHQNRSYDKNGAWAASGALDQGLLECMLSEPYLKRLPPKSTGRELFNLAWVEARCTQHGTAVSTENTQNTLGRFTAESIAIQLPDNVDSVFVCGGGAENPWLIQQIREACDAPVNSTDTLGVDPQWIEAAAFAWFAYATLQGKTSTLPAVTGATKPVVTGAIYLA